MNTDINIPFDEIFANRKYLTNQAKKIGFGDTDLNFICKNLISVLASYEEYIDSDQNSDEASDLKTNIQDTFDVFMDKIKNVAEYQRIRNRLCKSKAEKKKKVAKKQKIDDATLFQLRGFALQLGLQKNETVSNDQALKFLLDHADKTIRFS